MSRGLLALTAVTALVAFAGCGDDDDDDGSAGADEATAAETQAATTTEQAPATAAGTTIKAGDSQFGQVLFDGSDQAVYYFDKETSSESQCYGACAEAWPPVLTEGEAQGGNGVQAGMLGTTERRDGTTQVTYNGRPLYYYDEPAGQVTCHNVDEFGGLWLAVQPNGEAVPS
ncbi:MAG: COG4315 family predicted lipoprotein [Solirubrobacterales bacterium]